MVERLALPWINKATLEEALIQNASYMAVMRFVLADPEKRLFLAERFYFRGSVDDWINISGPAQKRKWSRNSCSASASASFEATAGQRFRNALMLQKSGPY